METPHTPGGIAGTEGSTMTDKKRLPTTLGGDRMIGDEELLDDVEGHKFKIHASGDDDVEGHKFKIHASGDDDVEGHIKTPPSATGDDDVEGHKWANKPG